MRIMHFDEQGRRLLTYPELAEALGLYESSVRARVSEQGIEGVPFGTGGRMKMFYADQFDIKVSPASAAELAAAVRRAARVQTPA